MSMGEIINVILCVLSFVLAAISVITVVITLKQNNKMLESNSRPYVVAYLVYQEDPSHIFFCIKNFGNTSAIINSLSINPEISLYKKTCNDVVNNTMLAPNQQMHFLVSKENKEKIIYECQNEFSVVLEYKDCCTEKVYKESYNINMEYIMTVLSVQHNKSNYTPEQNSLHNIERILDFTKNSNM
ncbi:MAG: hypothetical protein E7600_08980 [Ruminococcaceae bacterium]|nr:hypothetical protein [Oscillospiraceae bacterium]